jgi:hypothetical protein
MKLSKGCGPNLASIHKICHIHIIYGIYYVYKYKLNNFFMYIHIQYMCLYINAYIYWCMVEVLYQPQYTWSRGWYKTDTRLVLPGLLLSWYWYNAGIASWTMCVDTRAQAYIPDQHLSFPSLFKVFAWGIEPFLDSNVIEQYGLYTLVPWPIRH